MMLVEAIRSAVSEHAVYFLATAYLESVLHFHTSLGLPEHVVRLPLAGMDDLLARTQTLRDIGIASRSTAGVAEAIGVLECAAARLQELSQAPGGAVEDARGLKQAAA